MGGDLHEVERGGDFPLDRYIAYSDVLSDNRCVEEAHESRLYRYATSGARTHCARGDATHKHGPVLLSADLHVPGEIDGGARLVEGLLLPFLLELLARDVSAVDDGGGVVRHERVECGVEGRWGRGFENGGQVVLGPESEGEKDDG